MVYTLPMPKEARTIDGAKVKALREERGLTRAELAERAGISRPLVVLIETGQRRHPSGNTLAALAEFFRVLPEDLLVGGPDDQDPEVQAERRMLDRYRRLTPRQKRRVEAIIADMLGDSRTEDKP